MERYSDPVNSGSTTSILAATNAIAAVNSWDDLTVKRRQDLASALNTACRLLGLPPDAVILTPPALRDGLLTLSAAGAGVGLSRWRNIRSHLTFVMRRLGCIDLKPPLTPAWEALLALLDSRKRASVVTLARYCSAHAVAPDAVDAQVMPGFIDWLTQRTLEAKPTAFAGVARGNWNRFTSSIPGWPSQKIEPLRDPRQFILPLAAFTPAFQQDVAAFEARLQRSILNDPLGDEPEDDGPDGGATDSMPSTSMRKPLRESSAKGRSSHARWAASALVATGVPIEEITALAGLVQPLANAKAIMTFLYDRAHQGQSSQGTHIGGVLRMIAKYEVHSPASDIERISHWATLLSLKYDGMTEKNQRAIGAAMRPSHDIKLLGLPGALLAAAGRLLKGSPRQAATQAWRAVALAFLIRVPLRLANIIELRLDRHLQRDDPRRPDLHAIHIPAEETKTGKPLMRPIPADLNLVLQKWITVFRPLIAGPGNPYLFPAFDRREGHINRQGFRKAISEATHKHVGVRLSPHQFRHLAGKRMLTAYPGEYESVRQLLGHSRLETTVKHYTGTDVEVAAARFDALITVAPIAKAKRKVRVRKPKAKPTGNQPDDPDAGPKGPRGRSGDSR
jgi:hypothetical protein